MQELVYQTVLAAVEQVCGQAATTGQHIQLNRPEPQFGDFTTNVAMQLAKPLGQNPRQLAESIAEHINQNNHSSDHNTKLSASVAGPGFINISLSDEMLWQAVLAATKLDQNWAGKIVVAEYSDPNPFKVLHAGHLYTSVVGDAMANLLQSAGATVHRVNFGGDVGLHVGKTMWAILQELGGENPDKLDSIPANQRSEWMAAAYASGTKAYEDDPEAKQAITNLNKRVYDLHQEQDHASPFAQIYWTCRQWSYEYFDAFYDRIGTKFDKYYPESQTAGIGLEVVKQQLAKGVFKESAGAVIFEGEPYGLHTRVFINQQGLPTYETKDVGLIILKDQDYHFDQSVVITGNEQEQYMSVVLKAIEQFAPKLAQATTHVTHGLVKLQGGVKMSSRKGNFLRAVDVLDEAAAAYASIGQQKDASPEAANKTVLGAVKYAFLKVRAGGDIVYNPTESVSLEGNSGPYLQYAHARACRILDKAQYKNQAPGTANSKHPTLEPGERLLAQKLAEFPSTAAKATTELMPHIVCTYLYELSQIFNSFYEKNRVIGDPRQTERVQLVACYRQVLGSGLNLLGIHAPDHM